MKSTVLESIHTLSWFSLDSLPVVALGTMDLDQFLAASVMTSNYLVLQATPFAEREKGLVML